MGALADGSGETPTPTTTAEGVLAVGGAEGLVEGPDPSGALAVGSAPTVGVVFE